MSDCGMKNAANYLMEELTTDVNMTFPEVDLNDPLFNFPGDINSALYQNVKALTNEDFTARVVGGQGTFDAMMAGVKAHLNEQWDAGRITGDDYSKVYLAMTEAAMSNSVQFLINRDATYWASQTAQLQAITARIQLETEKARLAMAQVEALNAKSNYALSKAALAKTQVEHCMLKFQLDNILPKENIALIRQNEGLGIDNLTKQFNLDSILITQHAGLEIDNNIKTFNLENMLPIDHSTKSYTVTKLMPAQLDLIKEQYEVQLAQTADFRSDQSPVVGTLGKQKDLYTQQIESYKRNSEFQAAKVFSDAWITQKTIDEGILPPNVFANANIESVMTTLMNKNGL